MIKSLIISIFAIGLGVAALRATGSYTFTDLTPGAYMSEVETLDDAGRITGVTTITNDPMDPGMRPFIWENGHLGVVPLPTSGRILSLTEDGVATGEGAYFGDFSALWKNGVVTSLGDGDSFRGRVSLSLGGDVYAGIYKFGYYQRPHIFVRTPASFTDLTPFGDQAYIMTVTPSGYLVGGYSGFDNTRHLFSWKEGTLQELAPAGATSIWAIPEFTDEALGQIVGTYTTESFSQGFKNFAYVWRDGVFTTLVPTSTDSRVSAVGIAGEVGGDFKDSSGRWHSFLWRDGTFKDLTPTGTADDFLRWISDSGYILIEQDSLIYQMKDDLLTPLAPSGSLNASIAEYLPDGTVLFSYQDTVRERHLGFWKDGAITLIFAPWLTDVREIGVIDHSKPGRMVCEWTDSASTNHAFVWEEGIVTEIVPPVPGTSIIVDKITASGYVAGDFHGENNQNFHPFVWFKGITSDLSRPGEESGRLANISESGIAGAVSYTEEGAGNFKAHVFIWENGNFTDLPNPPHGRLFAIEDIYDSGMVVGAYTYYLPYTDITGHPYDIPDGASGLNERFVWKDGAYVTVPGAISITFNAPNAQGVSLGVYYDSHNGDYRPHGLVLEDNVITNLEDFLPPGSVDSSPVFLNATGQIAGTYTAPRTYRQHAFLLTPGLFTPFPEEAVASASPSRSSKPSLSLAKRPPAFTQRRVISLQGTAIGRVSYRIKSGVWRRIALRSPGQWQAQIPLEIGKNTIFFRATSATGKSRITKISITRRSSAP